MKTSTKQRIESIRELVKYWPLKRDTVEEDSLGIAGGSERESRTATNLGTLLTVSKTSK